MTPRLRAALIRAGIGCLLTFLTTAGVAEALTAGQWKLALSVDGTAVLVYLVARGGLEGVYDAWRAAMGEVRPGDVQAPAPSGPVPATPVPPSTTT